ncbi:MAG: hypothetical protein ACO29C_06435 [Fluviibacter sp.]
MEIVKTSINMPVDLHKKLKLEAHQRGVTIGDAINVAVQAWISSGTGMSAGIDIVAANENPAAAMWTAKLRFILDRGALTQQTGIQLALDTFEALIREREKRGRFNATE